MAPLSGPCSTIRIVENKYWIEDALSNAVRVMETGLAMVVTAAARTDIGRVRRKNQDAFRVGNEAQLYVVCDGMGGAVGGEVASALACNAFVEAFTDLHVKRSGDSGESVKDALFHSAQWANKAVRDRVREQPALRGMGTTLVAAAVEDSRLLLVNVGDSRAYLLRDGVSSQLTKDHSFLDEQVRAGIMTREQADASALQSVITRAVGIDEKVDADLYGVALEDGDVALLTSDGLTRHVTDDEIATLGPHCTECDATELSRHVDWLIELALDRGGSDNVTCILLQFKLA